MKAARAACRNPPLACFIVASLIFASSALHGCSKMSNGFFWRGSCPAAYISCRMLRLSHCVSPLKAGPRRFKHGSASHHLGKEQPRPAGIGNRLHLSPAAAGLRTMTAPLVQWVTVRSWLRPAALQSRRLVLASASPALRTPYATHQSEREQEREQKVPDDDDIDL